MTILFHEMYRDLRTDTEKRLALYWVDADTEVECFKKIYTKYVRPLRYMNGHRIKLMNEEQHKRFIEWQKDGITIEMYYGNGTID